MTATPPLTTATSAPAPVRRWLVAAGACLLAASVALAAYASHGVDGDARTRLQTAAAFGFGHGLALVALGPQARSRSTLALLAVLLAGALLFCGAMTASVLLGIRASVAPLGGLLLIAGWLGWALAAVRGR